MPFEGNSSTTVWDFLFLCTKKRYEIISFKGCIINSVGEYLTNTIFI